MIRLRVTEFVDEAQTPTSARWWNNFNLYCAEQNGLFAPRTEEMLEEWGAKAGWHPDGWTCIDFERDSDATAFLLRFG